MSVFDVVQEDGIAPVSGHRSSGERLRAVLDPLWRRLLWMRARRGTDVRVDEGAFAAAPVQLSDAENDRVREILARRLSS